MGQIDDVMNGLAQRNGQSSGSAVPSRNNLNLRQQLIAQRSTHQGELERLDEEIIALQNLRKERAQEIADLTRQIVALDERVVAGRSANTVRNYYDKFEWSNRLEEQMKRVFGIDEFRLAQEGCVIY
jgi:septal ring factor EnvC (AmiA/AmiB activator)